MDDLTPEKEARLERLLKLPPETIDRLERVARDDERMEWLWASVRRWAAAAAAVIGAIILFGEQVKAAVRFVIKGVGE